MYIFLDVDGVLNTSSQWRIKNYALNDKCLNNFYALLEVIDDPKIVLSSTWRNGIARDGSKAAHVNDLINALSKAGIYDMDKTATSPDGSRSKEIDYYLRRHPRDKYIILDDDATLFDENNENLYLINPATGLTQKDVEKILKDIECWNKKR